jgi:hypothetical protein
MAHIAWISTCGTIELFRVIRSDRHLLSSSGARQIGSEIMPDKPQYLRGVRGAISGEGRVGQLECLGAKGNKHNRHTL